MGSPRFLKPSGNQAPTLDIWTFGTQILERTGLKVLHCLILFTVQFVYTHLFCQQTSQKHLKLFTPPHVTWSLKLLSLRGMGYREREREHCICISMGRKNHRIQNKNTKQYKNTTNNSKAPQASHPSSSCRQPCLNVHLAGSHSHVIRELDFENFGALAILWPFGFFWILLDSAVSPSACSSFERNLC